MQPYDNTRSTQNGQALDYLPVHVPRPKKTARFAKARAAVRDWWNAAWEVDGVLHALWDDVLSAPEDGLRYMAPWLRTVLAIAGVSFVVLLAQAAGEVVLQALYQLLTAVPKVQVGVDTSNSVFAVVDQPVRTYIAQHAAGLPIAASTVYTLWLLTGIVGLVFGYLSQNNGARAVGRTRRSHRVHGLDGHPGHQPPRRRRADRPRLDVPVRVRDARPDPAPPGRRRPPREGHRPARGPRPGAGSGRTRRRPPAPGLPLPGLTPVAPPGPRPPRHGWARAGQADRPPRSAPADEPLAGALLAVHRHLEEPLVLIPRPRRRIGRPRPQRPGPRYPHRPDRLPGAWSR
ncbi:hypothetical protein [Streptomyces puniciscabiei]|uniref:hypothetical protein n=1 Tax=Streptomyces puniciscabiei TaxID=164348 RepID=UPI0033198901